MLSRAANSIYWMSRYLERADSVARLLRVNLHLSLDMRMTSQDAQWAPLVLASGDVAAFEQRYTDYRESHVVQFLTFDLDNANSLLSCICRARENARTVREVIPSELWEAVNILYHDVQAAKHEPEQPDLQAFYRHISERMHLFAGLMDDVMSHGQGWHFARMGKLLERADRTTRMLDMKYFLLLPKAEDVDSPQDAVEWGAVLKSANGFEMYRKKFHRVNYRDVVDFLFFDPYFPRSVRFCVAEAAASHTRILAMLEMASPVQQEMAALQQWLERMDVAQVLTDGMHEFIDAFQIRLNRVDEAIYQAFFALRDA
jgi:uncharacterized alpha-E superfamily protein